MCVCVYKEEEEKEEKIYKEEEERMGAVGGDSSAAGGGGWETRSPMPLLYRRRSSGEVMRNMASVSSSLLPAFGTVVAQGTHPPIAPYIIAPFDRRYRYLSYLSLTSHLSCIHSSFNNSFEV